MSQQIKDAFVKEYGTEEAYGNKQAYSALYVVFARGWNACEAAQQSAQADVCPVCRATYFVKRNDDVEICDSCSTPRARG